METSNYTVLIAEDDAVLGSLLCDFLTAEGFTVQLCVNGELAWEAFQKSTIHLCLFDVMMPVLDGFSLAKRVRALNTTIPILFLTAKGLKTDKLAGYKLGADDYLTKPFDEEELLWKIQALLRRLVSVEAVTSDTALIPIGVYVFDSANQEIRLGASSKRITEKECEILAYLVKNKNKVIRREEILVALWGKNDYFFGRSLDVFLTKLRKYLKEDANIQIENVFKVGFVFKVPN